MVRRTTKTQDGDAKPAERKSRSEPSHCYQVWKLTMQAFQALWSKLLLWSGSETFGARPQWTIELLLLLIAQSQGFTLQCFAPNCIQHDYQLYYDQIVESQWSWSWILQHLCSFGQTSDGVASRDIKHGHYNKSTILIVDEAKAVAQTPSMFIYPQCENYRASSANG